MTQDAFAVLADPTRRAILETLRDGEHPVGELVEAVGATQPTVSKHLRILREAHLVEQRADGQRRLYRLCEQGLEPVQLWMAQFCVPPEPHGDSTGGPGPNAASEGSDLPQESAPPRQVPTLTHREPRQQSSESAPPQSLDPLVVRQEEQPAGRSRLLPQIFRRRRR